MPGHGETATERVIETVARNVGADPIELPPLAEAVDPDALDALVRTLSEGEITFPYAGWIVCVDSTGTVQLEQRDVESVTSEESATSD